MKKVNGRKVVQADAPKQIWDDALEFGVYVRSNADLDIYMLQGKFA